MMISRIAAITLFAASFAIVLFTDGGVYPGSLSLAVIPMALSLVLSAATTSLKSETLPVFAGALAIWLLIALWTLVQISPLPGGVLANNAWTYLPMLGMGGWPRISVTPGDSLYSLLPVSLAFMTFLSALLLFPGDRQAEQALKVFAACGSLLALFAIIQFKLFPNTLMFSPKQDYLFSLTAPFVNRNTAATFYGLVLIAVIACLTLEASKARSWRHRQPGPVDPRWLFAGMGLLVILALALTTSRGGIGATVIAAGGLSAILLLWLQKAKGGRRLPMQRSGRRSRVMLAGSAATAVALLFILVFARTLFRTTMLGNEDGRFCVYPGILKSIGENWLTGVGAGAFEYVFSADMDPACGLINVWTRAHNGYFDLALAYGVALAAVVLLISLGLALHVVAKGLKHRKSKKPIVWAAASIIILVCVHTYIDFSMQIPGFAMSFMLVLALMARVSTNPSGRYRNIT